MLAGRNRWHYSTEWNLRFIQNVASCYVLCLTKESIITATLVHAPHVCVCVCHAHRTEVWVIRVRLKYEVEVGPDWIPIPDFEKPWSIPLRLKSKYLISTLVKRLFWCIYFIEKCTLPLWTVTIWSTLQCSEHQNDQTQKQFLPSSNPSHEHLTLNVEHKTLLYITYSSHILIFNFKFAHIRPVHK